MQKYTTFFDLLFWNQNSRASLESLNANLQLARENYGKELIKFQKLSVIQQKSSADILNLEENEETHVESQPETSQDHFTYWDSILQLALAYHAFNPIAPKIIRDFNHQKTKQHKNLSKILTQNSYSNFTKNLSYHDQVVCHLNKILENCDDVNFQALASLILYRKDNCKTDFGRACREFFEQNFNLEVILRERAGFQKSLGSEENSADQDLQADTALLILAGFYCRFSIVHATTNSQESVVKLNSILEVLENDISRRSASDVDYDRKNKLVWVLNYHKAEITKNFNRLTSLKLPRPDFAELLNLSNFQIISDKNSPFYLLSLQLHANHLIELGDILAAIQILKKSVFEIADFYDTEFSLHIAPVLIKLAGLNIQNDSFKEGYNYLEQCLDIFDINGVNKNSEDYLAIKNNMEVLLKDPELSKFKEEKFNLQARPGFKKDVKVRHASGV